MIAGSSGGHILPAIKYINNLSVIKEPKEILFISNEIGKNYLNTIKKHNKNKVKVKQLINFVKDRGGVEYAKKVMSKYKSMALNVLLEFPKNNFRRSLELMLDYVIERKY